MKLLAIDTATEACSVALQIGEHCFTHFEVCPQQQSQRLLPMVQALLKEAGMSIGDLDYLAFGRGPGSFTGVRIATGMVQGLALGGDLPVVGISTLAIMAQQAIAEQAAEQIAVAIDARMGEVYFACYQAKQGLATLVSDEQVLAPEAAAKQLDTQPQLAVGTGWQAYPQLQLEQIAGSNILYPNAKYMLPLASQAIEAGRAADVMNVQPTYLRDKVTWKKLPGRS